MTVVQPKSGIAYTVRSSEFYAQVVQPESGVTYTVRSPELYASVVQPKSGIAYTMRAPEFANTRSERNNTYHQGSSRMNDTYLQVAD